MNRALAAAFGLATMFALGATEQAQAQSDVERYYPVQMHSVIWYQGKDVQSGAKVAFLSISPVAREDRPGGRRLYTIQSRDNYLGIESVDYQEVSPEEVRLVRLVSRRAHPLGVTDTLMSPGLPLLRAPLEVGQSWGETMQDGLTYTYRIASKFDTPVFGKPFSNCLRVVRTRAGVEDYRTEYCPGVGIVGFEMLNSAAKWLRFDIFALQRDTELVAVRASPRGCTYEFLPLVPQGNQVVSVSPPLTPPIKFDRPKGNLLPVTVPDKSRQGPWVVLLQEANQSVATTLQTFNWTGECGANFLLPPPTQEPSLLMLRQEAESERVTVRMIGVGWKPGESLVFTANDMFGDKEKTFVVGTADASGVSPVFEMAFEADTLRGKHALQLEGGGRKATLDLNCLGAGFCMAPFWRK